MFNVELDELQRQLNMGDDELFLERKKKKKQQTNMVAKLSETIGKAKRLRKQEEHQLKKKLAKVSLDNGILLQEKLESIWNPDATKYGSSEIRAKIFKRKEKRKALNVDQIQAYQLILKYAKERTALPLAEEKQILDCLKLILENGWIVGDEELIKLFAVLDLKSKIVVTESAKDFFKFLFLLTKLFKLDYQKV